MTEDSVAFIPAPKVPRLHVGGLGYSYDRSKGAQVDGVSLAVGAGQVHAIMGPSGSGKTTILKLIAGFLTPHSGSISVGGCDMSVIQLGQRPVQLVFQDLRLFEHLTVSENVLFSKPRPSLADSKKCSALLNTVFIHEFLSIQKENTGLFLSRLAPLLYYPRIVAVPLVWEYSKAI